METLFGEIIPVVTDKNEFWLTSQMNEIKCFLNFLTMIKMMEGSEVLFVSQVILEKSQYLDWDLDGRIQA